MSYQMINNTTFVGLWVDDVRPVPDHLLERGWCWARSFHEAITKMELMQFDEISLDHDLASFYGPYKEMTGLDIVNWLIMQQHKGKFVPRVIYVHSANSVGHANMLAAIRELRGKNER